MRARGSLRVLVLMHEDLVPPADPAAAPEKERALWQAELDVLTALRRLGHECRALGVQSDLGAIREAIESWQPDITFNLLEEFHGVAVYDQHVVSFLELMRKPYTGCNPRGLTLARDKVLCKKLLSWHRIRVPGFAVYPLGRKVTPPRRLPYPLFVKSVNEEASLGIAQASIVHSDEKLAERVAFVHEQLGTDALVEQYVEGRELYVGMLGNGRVATLPTWELAFDNLPDDTAPIATARVKWDRKYQRKLGVRTGPAADLPEGLAQGIPRLCRRVWSALGLSGYARVDLRLAPDGQVYVLEANPNPNLQADEDFAAAAAAAGLEYKRLVRRLLALGLAYRAEWKSRAAV
jgi:D-alanine-D-alanine ligase